MKQMLISFAFAIVISPLAHAADYKLKSQIETSGQAISLADLIEGPNVPDTPVFGAPLPGKTGTIQTQRIIAAFKKATGETLAVTNDAPVRVMRRARIVSEHDVTESIAQSLMRDYKIIDPEIRLQTENGKFEIAAESDTQGKPIISHLQFDPQSLRFEAMISIADSATLSANPVKISGYVVADRLVPVFTRAIEKGAPIQSADLRLERRLRATLEGKTIPSLTELQTRVALNALMPGDVASDDVVGRPMLIEKGSFVTVSYEANGLLLSMRGRATESGALGDVIAFTNPQSKKSLLGTVTAAGQVRVTGFTTKQAQLDQAPVTIQ